MSSFEIVYVNHNVFAGDKWTRAEHKLGSDSFWLEPNWGPAVRPITKEEFELYKGKLASPVPPGMINGDYP